MRLEREFLPGEYPAVENCNMILMTAIVMVAEIMRKFLGYKGSFHPIKYSIHKATFCEIDNSNPSSGSRVFQEHRCCVYLEGAANKEDLYVVPWGNGALLTAECCLYRYGADGMYVPKSVYLTTGRRVKGEDERKRFVFLLKRESEKPGFEYNLSCSIKEVSVSSEENSPNFKIST